MFDLGTRIGRYRLDALLGEGGMGRVYRAFDEDLQRSVALKVLLATPADEGARSVWAARMLREARAAAAFDHPNAVSVFDVGQVEGSPFIVMELVPGRALRALVGDGATPVATKVAALAQAARALAAAHRAGLVHRDVKPDNVMLRDDGVAKVLDFGIARAAPSVEIDPSAPTAGASLGTLTGAGVVVGTPVYMAPEQIRHAPVDGRTDQFAWGVTAYEVLAGRLPWDAADAMALVAAVLTAEARPLREVAPDVPASVSDAVMRSLAKEPSRRFATLDEAADAMEGKATLPAAPAVPSAPAARRVVAFAAAIVLAAGAAALAIGRRGGVDAVAPASTESVSLRAGAAPAVPAASSPASAATATIEHDVLFPCDKTAADVQPVPAPRRCAGGETAWCDREGKSVACCGASLVAVSRDGVCSCGAGAAPDASGKCPAVPDRSADAIRAVVRAAFPSLRACYEASLGTNARLEGKVSVYFEIGPFGDVFFARLNAATLPDTRVQRCVRDAVRGLRFPPGGPTTVVYPIEFAPN